MANQGIRRMLTGIDGMDRLLGGGLPEGRISLVVGEAGTGKTILAHQLLVEAAKLDGGAGILVTCEETPAALREDLASFEWGQSVMEDEGRIAYVDASHDPSIQAVEVGDFDLDGLLARIDHAVQKHGAKRVAIDSLSNLVQRYSDPRMVRSGIARLVSELRRRSGTAILTAAASEHPGGLTLYGVEEYLADVVIHLRNRSEGERRRRTVEVLKLRGGQHWKGEVTFTIDPRQGFVALPSTSFHSAEEISSERISTGLTPLDAMAGGGLLRESVILISGPPGLGKSLTAAHFLEAGSNARRKSLLLAFEESQAQILRNAEGCGIGLRRAVDDGRVHVECVAPEGYSLGEHLLRLRMLIELHSPDRIVVDSLSALERMGDETAFREFMIGLNSILRTSGATCLLTSVSEPVSSTGSVMSQQVATLADMLIVLRYVENAGEIRRGMAILKMRGSNHDRKICEYQITDGGLIIGAPFKHVHGILSGVMQEVGRSELDRLNAMFEEGA